MKKIFTSWLFAGALLSGSPVFAQLAAGTYTIGGTTPDYPTINAAVTAMSPGITGAVTFHVRQGTYNEQVTIPAITGATAATPVTFTTDPANSSPAVIAFNSTTSTANWTLRFDGASYVTFDNIDLTAGGTTYARVIQYNAANYIAVTNATITGYNSAGTSNNTALVNGGTGAANLSQNLTFSDNSFVGGSYGFYLYGATTTNTESGNIIQNNSFTGYGYYGVYLYYQNNAIVHNNTFQNNGIYSTPRGIYMGYSTGGIISNNKVVLTSSGASEGIFVNYSDGTTANRIKVYNNFVSMSNSGTSTMYGLDMEYSNNVDIFFNSVNIVGGSTSTRALYVIGASDTTFVRNNNLASTGVAFYRSSGVMNSDYNNLYSTGTNLVYHGGNYTSLAAYQGGVGQDLNSISIDPMYVSATDLHTMNMLLNGSGSPVTYITTDIDNDPRGATPDIGADEITPLAVDAGVLSIDTPGVGNCSLGPVYATIRNYGTNPLTSVTVNWSVNTTAQTPAVHTLNLASGADTSVFLGNATMVLGDSITAFTSMPNGAAESALGAWNDLSWKYAKHALNGTYTLGGTGNYYQSFAVLISDLNMYGVCGPVTINVSNGTYTDQVVLNAIPGASAVNTVKFTSLSGDSSLAIITYGGNTSAANYTIQLNGASYVTFEKLTLANTSSTYGHVLEVLPGSHNNNYINCVFQGMPITGTGTNGSVIYSPSTGQINDNTFEGNRIIAGTYGMYWYGSNATVRSLNTIVRNNIFEGQDYSAARLYYHENITFSGNKASSTTSSTYYGLYIGYVAGMQISENEFASQTSTTSYGIYLTNSEGSLTTPGRISNNMIALGNSSSSTRYGIYSTDNGNLAIFHNNINLESASTTLRGIYASSGGNIRIFNNNIAVNGPGHGLYFVHSFSLADSDNNNFHIQQGDVAYIVTSTANTLQDWQNLSGYDMNSLAVNPMYTSFTDLHTCNAALDGAARPTSVSIDFDNQLRNQPADIGADEFLPANIDLGPDTSFCAGQSIVIGFPSSYGATFSWSNGDTTSSIMATSASNYSVIVNGSCGMGMDTISVSLDPAPLAGYTSTASYLAVTFNNTSSNATSYFWDFGDGTTSTLSDPVHVFANSGNQTVKLVAMNDCGADSITLQMNLQITSMQESTLEDVVNLFPNPSDGNFTLTIEGAQSGNYVIEVLSLQGQLMHRENASITAGSLKQSLGLSHLAKGAYILRIAGEAATTSVRMVIQ